MGNRTDDEAQRGEFGLKLADLGDVGADLDYIVDLSGGIAQRRRVHQHINLFPLVGRHHLFRLVDLAVFEGLFDNTGDTSLRPMHVNLVTSVPRRGPEILPQTAIRVDDPQIGILNRYVTGHFFKELAISFPAVPDLVLEKFEFGNVRGHPHHARDLSGLIRDGHGVDEQDHFISLLVTDELLDPVSQPVAEGALRRALLAALGPVLVDLVAIPPLELPEVPAKPPIGLNDPQIAIQDRQIGGHELEIVLIRIAGHTIVSPWCYACPTGVFVSRIFRMLVKRPSSLTGLSRYPSGGGTGRS